MMNPIEIRNEDRISFRDPWFGGARWSGSGRYEGSEVGMAGLAERYWKELRPSSAGRLRLDLAIRHAQEPTGRSAIRPRRHSRPRLRTASR